MSSKVIILGEFLIILEGKVDLLLGPVRYPQGLGACLMHDSRDSELLSLSVPASPLLL